MDISVEVKCVVSPVCIMKFRQGLYTLSNVKADTKDAHIVTLRTI